MPCVNVNAKVNEVGETHKANLSWRVTPQAMVYATYSTGFRPGGINRRGDIPPYGADFLSNYELGWKTTFGPVRWNGAIYHQRWKGFQFSFLGQNSLLANDRTGATLDILDPLGSPTSPLMFGQNQNLLQDT